MNLKQKEKTMVEAEYFQNFHCAASACQLTCCYGWRVDIGRSRYMRIRNAPKSPAMEKLIEKGIQRNKKAADDEYYGKINLGENGYCQFLDENMLCRLQMECGASVLPSICQTFPRRVALLDGLVERSCTAGCEEVVNLLWEMPHGLRFYCDSESPFAARGFRIEKAPENAWIYDRFLDVQTVCVDILQNRAYSLDERIILLGMAMKGLAEAEAHDEEQLEQWLKRFGALSSGDVLRETLDKMPQNPVQCVANNITVCRNILAINQKEQVSIVKRIWELLKIERDEAGTSKVDLEGYANAKKLLKEQLSGREYLLENVAVNQWFHDLAPLGWQGVWKSYMRFVVLYSLLKFFLISGVHEEASKEKIVHTITVWARTMAHNLKWMENLVDELENNHSDTLAHMAILVNG